MAYFTGFRFIPPVADPKAPAKKSTPPLKLGGSQASGLVRAVRWARGLGLVTSFVVALLGLVSAFGAVTEIFVLRVVVAVVLLVGVPLFVSDKLLARLRAPSDKLGIVLDVFTFFSLAIAWVFVAAFPRVLVSEGDRETRQGSLWLAKTSYFFGGVSPTFRTERTVTASPSASASASTSAAPSSSGSTQAPKEAH